MTHKKFDYSVSKDLDITVHFDLDFDGIDMTVSNIEFGNKSGKIGQIKWLGGEIPQITSVNHEVYNEKVKTDIISQIQLIMINEKPLFNP